MTIEASGRTRVPLLFRHHGRESGQTAEPCADSHGEEGADYQYAILELADHSRSESGELDVEFRGSIGFPSDRRVQRDSGVSSDLGGATALHMASELFIKSTGVILV